MHFRVLPFAASTVDVKQRFSSLRKLCLGGTLLCLAAASTARAGFSTVNVTPQDEQTQADILNHIYGGAFSLTGDGVDYNNGTLSAVRVSDYLPSTSAADSPGPNGTDQLWQDNQVVSNLEAVYAEYKTTSFGYIPGSANGTYQPELAISGSGYAVSGSDTFSPGSGPFRFAAQSPYGLLSSSPSDNVDGKDHVVTYEIDGINDNYKTWLLFFDDYGDNGRDADFDYQDLVVQIKTVPAAVSAPSVPEPASLTLIAGGAVVLLKRVRRRPVSI